MLRNTIEAQPKYHGLFGDHGFLVQQRVCHTFGGSKIVAPHRDFVEQPPASSTDPDQFFAPQRIQGTLILTEHGRDYQGSGFLFQDNSGKTINVAEECTPEPGDLLFWRHVNLHSVTDVTTPPASLGFLRIIYPIFKFNQQPKKILIPTSSTVKKIGEYSNKHIIEITVAP